MTDEILDPDGLRDLTARVAALPKEIDPPQAAWSTIKAEIASPARVSSIAFWQRPAFLVAASLLLVAGSSAITAIAIKRSNDSTAQVASAVAPLAPQGDAPATLAQFTVVENEYISTANRLSAVLESDEVQLAPETVAKLKESLRVIDAAILEARAALASDPANPQLMEMLSTTYQHKVDLLRRTTEMGRS
jgi:hypothetical protein